MIYEDQPLRIRLKVDDDVLTDYSSLQIKYLDSSGNEGIWTAFLYSLDNKYIYYDVSADILKYGDWKVKSFVTFNDGKAYPGKTVYFTVSSKWD